MVHFVLLQKLPLAKETAQLLIRVSPPRAPHGRGLGPGATVFVCLLDRVLQADGRHSQPIFRLPTSVQWTDGETEPGPGGRDLLHGLQGFCLLVLPSRMGGVCTQLPAHLSDGDVTLSMCIWLSASSVSGF